MAQQGGNRGRRPGAQALEAQVHFAVFKKLVLKGS